MNKKLRCEPSNLGVISPMILFPAELIVEIAKNFDLKCLANFNVVSKFHHHIVKTTPWKIELSAGNATAWNTLLHYNFANIIVDPNIVFTDECLQVLQNCHTVYLSWTKITDGELKHLSKCRAINLRCTGITDEGLKHLSKCRAISLCCTKITDGGLKHLSKCHTVNLAGTKITDEGLKHLSKCRTVNLSHTKITDEGLKHLRSKCGVTIC